MRVIISVAAARAVFISFLVSSSASLTISITRFIGIFAGGIFSVACSFGVISFSILLAPSLLITFLSFPFLALFGFGTLTIGSLLEIELILEGICGVGLRLTLRCTLWCLLGLGGVREHLIEDDSHHLVSAIRQVLRRHGGHVLDVTEMVIDGIEHPRNVVRHQVSDIVLLPLTEFAPQQAMRVHLSCKEGADGRVIQTLFLLNLLGFLDGVLNQILRTDGDGSTDEVPLLAWESVDHQLFDASVFTHVVEEVRRVQQLLGDLLEPLGLAHVEHLALTLPLSHHLLWWR